MADDQRSADDLTPVTLDKRLVGERNRTDVLTWLARFGGLTLPKGKPWLAER